MDSITVFNRLFDENIIVGRALANQIKNWPTRPLNLTKNCRIFDQLKEDDSRIVEGLSDECYELLCVSAYVRKALIQRGLMNIQYYILLDEAMKIQLEQGKIGSKGGRKQKGGMKLRELLARLGLAFALLGSSEGISSTESSGVELESSHYTEQPVVAFSSPLSPASSKEEFQQGRLVAAEKEIGTMVASTRPWLLPERSLTIATGVTDSQVDFFRTTIDDLNSRLASSAKDATVMCGEIASSASDADVFSNEAFVQKVLAIAEKKVAEGETKSTSEGYQDKVAYVTTGAMNVASRLTYGMVGYKASERQVDSTAVMKEAYEEVTMEMNMGRVAQVESFAYSHYYQQLCRATPKPSFQVSTEGDTLYLKTSFGNNDTGTLLLAHMDTLERIKVKLADAKLTEQNKGVLESLSERIQMEIKLIESSALFAPLDGLSPGLGAVQGVIGDGTVATAKFEEIVNRIAEMLPISEAAARDLAAVRKSMFEMKQASRNQVASEWRVVISDSTTAATAVLTDAVQNTADATAEVAATASGLGQVILEEGGELFTTGVGVAGDVLGAGLDEAGKAIDKTGDIATGLFDKVAGRILIGLGIAGVGAWIVLTFKRGMLSFGNGNGNGNAQQQQEMQALRDQVQQLLLLQQQQQQLPAQPAAAQPAAAQPIANGLDILANAAAAQAGGTLKRKKHSKKTSRKIKNRRVKKTKARKAKKTKKSASKKIKKH